MLARGSPLNGPGLVSGRVLVVYDLTTSARGHGALTPEERARHMKGIEKMRRRLFCRYPPADYFIVNGSERILSASAESCWNTACGTYRVFRFGGLAYDIDYADHAGPYRFSVSHFDADTFIFWLGAPQGHTLSCLNIAFRDLHELPYAYVRSCRCANLAPVYVSLKDK